MPDKVCVAIVVGERKLHFPVPGRLQLAFLLALWFTPRDEALGATHSSLAQTLRVNKLDGREGRIEPAKSRE
ncbi:MAG TPA: hypothetical protein VJS37_11765 [Terriglobales bacterium]|nr:hypothetical protein [Terriglobales bacterium]